MSKSGRGDDSEVRLKQQEIEQKRARGAISCAECRRLKLKCDKSVPCGSCRRRGCESICPKYTDRARSFVLADTDRLHKKMADMSERIRQLEDALSIAQSSLSHEPHPLLSADKMKIKSNLEMHAAVNEDNDAGFGPNGQNESDTDYIDAFGTLAVHEDGGSTFYGRSAGSEGTEDGPPTPLASASRDAATILPPDIAHYSSSLPLALGPLPPMSFQDMIRRYLPHWERARELADIYEEYEIWFFQAVTRRQLEEQLLPMFYVEAPRSTTSLPRPGPHDLCSQRAVVFVVFCLGAIFDRNRPAPPERNAESELYYHLSRAALNLQPILEHPSSLSTVQTFSTLAIYQALTCDDNAIEGLWANMGLATKLAQSVNRDCARWGLSNLEIHARRCLFWEVCTTDCWVSLATGRIQSFPIAHVDCELALDPDQTLSEDGQVQSSLPAWKARFGAKCLSVLAASLTAKVPKYSTILDIDRQFRDMELPHFAQGGVPQNVGLSATMQYFMPQNYTRYAMMYLHRVFFAQALVDRTGDPLKSPYAPSFLAGYRAACETVSLLRQQFDLFPLELARVWVLWTHAFSATLSTAILRLVFMITSVVTHASRSKVAQSALEEMDKARALFEDAARIGGRAVKFVPKVRHFFEKAHQAFYASQGQDVRRPDIFSPRGADEDKEKLHIFLGRTNKVSTKSASS
ncbi:hypothetical protein PUNSTDRAFT_30245, partial [Punctularia strigosozonata HHB-11173 SS5]|uniref:uncharacterized protein n=1 Tax=Punctularia strigosozonata (strain HHB-11173) TaxID=741275 RepID=UPI00044178DF